MEMSLSADAWDPDAESIRAQLARASRGLECYSLQRWAVQQGWCEEGSFPLLGLPVARSERAHRGF